MLTRLFGQQRFLLFFSLAPLILITPAVVYAQWEPDVRLTYNDSASLLSNNNAHCLAASGDTLHVVWHDNRTGNYKIYYKRSTDTGTTWGQDTCLSSGPDSSTNPSIAVSGSNVHLVWQDHRDGNWEIYYKRSSDGGTNWSPEIRLTYDSASSQAPSLAASDSLVYLVWRDTSNIFFKRSWDLGNSWSQDTCLSGSVPWGAKYGSIAQAGFDVHVAYQGGGNIYYKQSTNRGLSWNTDVIIDSTFFSGNLEYVQYRPAIAALGSTVHLVWLEWSCWIGEPWTWCDILYEHSTDEGNSWSGMADLFGSGRNGGIDYPCCCASGQNVHVACVEYPDPYSNIYEIPYRHSTDEGNSWDSGINLRADSTISGNPFIAISGPMVHVVWCDARDGNYEIYYKRNPAGNLGIEVSPSRESRVTGYGVFPNPFVSFASVRGHTSDHFALYDISGRKVGVYRGDRIGADVSQGVYFIRAESGVGKPVRVVKVR